MKILKKILNKKIIIPIVIILALILVVNIFGGKGNSKTAFVTKDYTAEIGNIDSTISGKATIQPNDQYTVTSIVSGDVLATYFEEGDVLQKDAIMYEIDSSDISKSIESSQLSVEKANMSLSTTNDSIADMTIRSPYSGTISNLTVKVGDTIQNGQTIAKIYDDKNLILKVPFNETDAVNIWNGLSAEVSLTKDGTILYGTVKSKSNSAYSLSGNMRVVDIEIAVSNPSSIQAGDKATAIINGNYACNSAGVFEYSVDENLKATASGRIIELNIKENSRINAGNVVAILDTENLLTQRRSNEITVREAQLARERTLDQLDDYTIKAPIDGTVITKDVKTGDKLDNTKGATQLATIYDLSSMKFSMDVDELDVAKVKIGQEVIITADAVPGKTYTGHVEKINIKGSSSNGVTTYPITVRITEFEDLLPGMNIDAEIVIEQVKDVIIIPSECVNRGNIVYVKGTKTDANDTAPEGYKSVKVETGLADSMYIEITSGLKSGDVVRGKEIATNNKIMEAMDAMEEQMQSGGMPPMGGGMPAGGMR